MSLIETTSEVAAAWARFGDSIGRAREVLLGDGEHLKGRDASDGEAFLLHIMRAALNLYVDNGDPNRPRFTPFIHPLHRLYGDCPDADYLYAPIGPGRSYRVSGNRSGVTYLSFCTYAGSADGGPPKRVVSNITHEELEFDDDGDFELWITADRHPGNWLPLEPDSSALVLRQYFLDRTKQEPARCVIEAVPASDQPPNAPSRIVDRINAAANFLQTSSTVTTMLAAGLSGRALNAFAERPTAAPPRQRQGAALFPTPDNVYRLGWFDLDEEEALVIRATPPRSVYWSLHLCNRWFQSVQDDGGSACLNKRTATLDADGSFTMVVSHLEPPTSNWLNCMGHDNGILLFRWLLAEDAPTPICERVPFADVGARVHP